LSGRPACVAGERRTKRGKELALARWHPAFGGGRLNSSAIQATEDAAPRSVRRRQTRAMGFRATTPHEFLITIPSRICAAVSVASIAFSSTAKMSFQRITTIGSIPLENSEATASREIRSPSFSSRWISIQ